MAGLLAPPEASASDPVKKSDDWRLPFVNKRYTKLIALLADRLDEKTFNEVFEKLGRDCSASISWIKECRNDPDRYFSILKSRWHEDAVYDREKGIVTITSAERTACDCPLIGENRADPRVCNCSLGWQSQTFETVFGKKVRVELKESILRGGKHCTFEIRIGKDAATA